MPKSQVLDMSSPQAVSTTSINTSWSITNNSGIDVYAISGYADGVLPVEQLYEQKLTILETTDGQKIIKTGTTVTIKLSGTHKDKNNNDRDNTLYDIIITQTDTLFPVKVIGLDYDSDKAAFPSAEVTADDRSNMQKAETFKKAITAYPSLTLAQNYAAALKDDDLADDEAADSINKLFFQKQTKEYTKVEFSMVVAVDTYYKTYPFPWTNNAQKKNYYLYTSDGSANRSLGFVSLKNDCSTPIGTDKTVQGFSITYTNENNESQPLHYSGGQFVEDADSDTPKICLEGLFILKSILTKQDKDALIIPILSGTVNGLKALGYDDEQEEDDKDKWSGTYVMLHPKNMMDLLQLFAFSMGIILGLDWLREKVWNKVKAAREFGKDFMTKREFKNTNDQIKENMEKLLEKINDQAKLPEPIDLEADMAVLKQKVADVYIEDSRSAMGDMVKNQQAYMEEVAKFGVTDDLQDVADSLLDVSSKLKDLDTKDFGAATKDMLKNLKDNTTTLNDRATEVRKNAKQDAKEKMDKSKEAVEEASERVEENEKSREEWDREEVPEIEVEG